MSEYQRKTNTSKEHFVTVSGTGQLLWNVCVCVCVFYNLTFPKTS